MISKEDLNEISTKYGIEFSIYGNTARAFYTDWKDIKKYYKRRPGSKILIEVYLDKIKEWYSWCPYKVCEDCTENNGWRGRNNQKGYGYITFPKSLEDISLWRVEDFLEGSTLSPFKLGEYKMYLNTKEDVEKYLNLCIKQHEAMNELANDATYKGCLNTYKENTKQIETLTESNKSIIKKLQTVIQRKAKINSDSDEE